jgi:hypothetical protein
MSSIEQIETNRCNALKSTGPTTPEGKRRSRLLELAERVWRSANGPNLPFKSIDALCVESSNLVKLFNSVRGIPMGQSWKT